MSTAVTFWDRVDRTAGPVACWPAKVKPHKSGYVYFSIDGRHRRAHRVAYELAKGPIPDGLQIDHLCRNRACANPAHLEAVTQAENCLRGAQVNRVETCKRGHPLNGDNLYLSRDNFRNCRTCQRARARAWYVRRLTRLRLIEGEKPVRESE